MREPSCSTGTANSVFARAMLLAGAALLPCAGALAQPAESFAGKQVSILIGSAAGGGYDAYARALARHLGRHLPGQPSLIPKNMPGAGGLTLANYLFNRGPQDGTEIGIVQNGLPFEKLFQTLSADGKNALYDSTRFGWIGSMTQTVFVTVTWHDAPVKTFADARGREAILGATTPSADSSILAQLSNNLLGTKFEVVHGYDGANAVDLAVEKGEVHGEAGKDWTTLKSTRPQWVSEKKINILLQMGTKPHPEIKDAPMALELARTAEDRRVMEVIFAKYGMSRPFLAPPGLAPERLALLRHAFDETMRDPAFLAEAERLGMEINPVGGAEVQKLVASIMATPVDLAERAREALRPK